MFLRAVLTSSIIVEAGRRVEGGERERGGGGGREGSKGVMSNDVRGELG